MPNWQPNWNNVVWDWGAANEAIAALHRAAGRLEESVGERQRVEILKALYRKAKILVLDEPTAVLTPQESAALFETLKRFVAKGLSIIFISHKLGEILAGLDLRKHLIDLGLRGGLSLSLIRLAVREADQNMAALDPLGKLGVRHFDGLLRSLLNQSGSPDSHNEPVAADMELIAEVLDGLGVRLLDRFGFLGVELLRRERHEAVVL